MYQAISLPVAGQLLRDLHLEDTPAAQRRMCRAVEIATADPTMILVASQATDVAQVRSQRRDKVYTVFRALDCNCPDARTHRPCKHAMSVMLYHELKKDRFFIDRRCAELPPVGDSIESFEHFQYVDEINYKESKAMMIYESRANYGYQAPRSPYHDRLVKIDHAMWNNVVNELDELVNEMKADEDGVEKAYRILANSTNPFEAEKAEEEYDAFQADFAALSDLLESITKAHAKLEDFNFKFKREFSPRRSFKAVPHDSTWRSTDV